MKSLLVCLSIAVLAPLSAHAGVGDNILASFRVTASSISNNHMVAPWSDMVPGQWLDPTSGALGGAPSCASGSMQKFGKPFC